ncbi:ABC transporter permease [Zavarzinia sp. CC-PAN008]|uniref:ABC transporter permease n=1 Tax=Zavarzinia sp. CC-PAN008 TaxID=3243332 RepID=UPI003F74A361
MAFYALRRLGLAVLVLLVTTTMLFGLVYVVPGDPASVALGPRASEAVREAFRQRMGLDQPLVVQWWNFVSRLVQGDLGTDVLTGRPVNELVLGALPHTLALTALGIGWAILLGVPLGVWSALHRDGIVDRVAGVLSISVISLPSFVVAIYALLLFAVQLKWFPAIGAGEPGQWGQKLHHLVLPAFAVGLGWLGYLSRLVRAAMIDVLGEQHVRTFRAFGIRDSWIALRYALPVALPPVIAVLGIGIGALLSGAVLTEIVFARPGLGRLTYDAVITRNFPVVMGTVVVTAALYLLCNLAADLLVARLDPRVRRAL